MLWKMTTFMLQQFIIMGAMLITVANHHHHLNPLHNTSSREFKQIAKETYDKVIPCIITNSWMYENKNHSQFLFPDDAEDHFLEIKRKTEEQRNAAVHKYAGYAGPWIENRFIHKYFNRSLHSFNGLIPLFVQWIDYQILSDPRFDTTFKDHITSILRPNVLYLAISQGDVGLGKIAKANPNILVLSAGGFGHVPLPLIKGEIFPVCPVVHFEQEIAFFGSMQSSRPPMLNNVKSAADEFKMSYRQALSNNWQHDMEFTKFNVAPRGYGRSSFRFAEAIQMGRIPTFLYDDIPWIPYQGSELSVETFGFSSHTNNIKDTVQLLKNMTDAEYDRRISVMKLVRPFYTYEGVFGEIDKFIGDPFGNSGGHLKDVFRIPRQKDVVGNKIICVLCIILVTNSASKLTTLQEKKIYISSLNSQ